MGPTSAGHIENEGYVALTAASVSTLLSDARRSKSEAQYLSSLREAEDR